MKVLLITEATLDLENAATSIQSETSRAPRDSPHSIPVVSAAVSPDAMLCWRRRPASGPWYVCSLDKRIT